MIKSINNTSTIAAEDDEPQLVILLYSSFSYAFKIFYGISRKMFLYITILLHYI